MDWEALAYWARPALERGSRIPAEVVCELERRCPGYLDERLTAPAMTIPVVVRKTGSDLMLWIADHFFQDAKTEGWFDAILMQARSHPRAIRTMEFADHCDEVWSSGMPEPYPLF